MTDQDLLTTKQAADTLRTTVATLADWRHRRRGPRYLKIGRKVLYRMEDLSAYLAEHVIDPQACSSKRG